MFATRRHGIFLSIENPYWAAILAAIWKFMSPYFSLLTWSLSYLSLPISTTSPDIKTDEYALSINPEIVKGPDWFKICFWKFENCSRKFSMFFILAPLCLKGKYISRKTGNMFSNIYSLYALPPKTIAFCAVGSAHGLSLWMILLAARSLIFSAKSLNASATKFNAYKDSPSRLYLSGLRNVSLGKIALPRVFKVP